MTAADTLHTLTAADSAAVASGVGALFAGWGLPAQVVAALSSFVLGLPTIAVVLLARVPIFKWLAPAFHAWLDPVWERNKAWALPVLALLVGWLDTGNPLVGAAAVFLHQTVTGLVKAAKGTKGTVAAGTVGLLVLGLFLVPAHANASGAPKLAVVDSAGQTLPWLSLSRFPVTLALGESWNGRDLSLTPQAYGRFNVGYQLFPFLQVTAGARRQFVPGAKWNPESEMRLVLRR